MSVSERRVPRGVSTELFLNTARRIDSAVESSVSLLWRGVVERSATFDADARRLCARAAAGRFVHP